MLRALFLFLSKANWAQKFIMNWNFAWKVASRFIAGTTISEALDVVRKLNDHGFHVTLDYLGENSNSVEDSLNSTEEVLQLLDEIKLNSAKANVSIKLSQFGLKLDKELCKNNLLRIINKARENINFIRIDMEDSSLTSDTLEVVTWGQEIYSEIGTVIQSYLYRSEEDVINLLNNCIPIRMVKGAYNEPEEVAFPKKKDVDETFDLLVKSCMEHVEDCQFRKISEDGQFPPLIAVATHDLSRLEFAKNHANLIGLSKDHYEFQMLYGIRRDLQNNYVKLGYHVRVYVPYGTHWYPYFMRRLAERPANVWFFLSNLFR